LFLTFLKCAVGIEDDNLLDGPSRRH
jgi:hypothetical protein